MKEKYIILKVIEAKSTELAFIRNELSTKDYIEIENLFIISCNKAYKGKLAKLLTEEAIKFALFYVNDKTGGDFYENGMNKGDKKKIEEIVLDN